MRFRVIISVLCLLFTTNLLAQEKGVNKFEIGGGYTPFYFTYVDDGYNKQYDIAAYITGRYYLSDHFAVGAKVDFKTGPSVSSNDGYLSYLDALAVAEYNLFPSRIVNPYVSLGAGPAVGFRPFYNPVMLSISPSVGVELFKHVRLTGSITFPTTFVGIEGTYYDACFTLGVVF